MTHKQEQEDIRTGIDGLAGEFWLYMHSSVNDNPQPTVREVIDAYFQPINEGLTGCTLEELNQTINSITVIRERAIPDEYLDQPVSKYLTACKDQLITPFYDDLH